MGDQHEQRNHYRIQYPAGAKPLLETEGLQLRVTELSEGGVRVLELAPDLAAGTAVAGTLALCNGERHDVTSVVGRREGEETVLVQLAGVSFGAVMREQQHLVTHFPSYRASKR